MGSEPLEPEETDEVINEIPFDESGTISQGGKEVSSYSRDVNCFSFLIYFELSFIGVSYKKPPQHRFTFFFSNDYNPVNPYIAVFEDNYKTIVSFFFN